MSKTNIPSSGKGTPEAVPSNKVEEFFRILMDHTAAIAGRSGEEMEVLHEKRLKDCHDALTQPEQKTVKEILECLASDAKALDEGPAAANVARERSKVRDRIANVDQGNLARAADICSKLCAQTIGLALKTVGLTSVSVAGALFETTKAALRGIFHSAA